MRGHQKLVLSGIAVFTAMMGSAFGADFINGVGATFPAPIYQKWFGEFRAQRPNILINYQDIGSGAGIRQLTVGTVDFGASDKFMSDTQMARLSVKPLHFPTVLGAVVITYNVPGLKQALVMTSDVIAGIFLGDISKWNDPKLKAANPGVTLPDTPIIVVHRSDGSGTSFVFTEYLSKVSPSWKTKVGRGDAVSWPTGMGAKGTAGVAGFVKQNPYSIGYVELLYARQNKLAYAQVMNRSGNVVEPSIESVIAAAASTDMPADFRISITDAAGRDAYPISTYTWLLIPSRIADPTTRAALVDFLKWMLRTGQKGASQMNYAPLPSSVVTAELQQIALIR